MRVERRQGCSPDCTASNGQGYDTDLYREMYYVPRYGESRVEDRRRMGARSREREERDPKGIERAQGDGANMCRYWTGMANSKGYFSLLVASIITAGDSAPHMRCSRCLPSLYSAAEEQAVSVTSLEKQLELLYHRTSANRNRDTMDLSHLSLDFALITYLGT